MCRISRIYDVREQEKKSPATASERAAEHARRWHPDGLGPVYREFFETVRPQPFPPILPPQASTAT